LLTIGAGGNPVAVSRLCGDAGGEGGAAEARRPDAPDASGAKPAEVTITPGCAGGTAATGGPAGGPTVPDGSGADGSGADAAGGGLTATAWPTGGGFVVPDLRDGGAGDWAAPARGGSWTPVAGALRGRRGGRGGSRRPHAWHTASSSAFSALQNGQNRIAYRLCSR
jgi:hypothetical protein